MKKFIIPLIMIAGILFSCNNSANEEQKAEEKQNDLLEISGSIAGSEGDMLYFEKLSPAKLMKLDSVTLSADGSFSFTDKPANANLYRIRIENDGVFIIGSPGETIKISADERPITTNYTVSGSPDSKLAMEMNKHLMQTANKLQELGDEYRAAQNKSKAEQQQILNRLNKEAEELISAEKEFLTQMIKDNEESLFIYLALFQQLGQTTIFSYPEDKEMFKFVADKLEEYNPESPYTKSLKSDITKMDKQANQQQGPGAGFDVGDTPPDIQMQTPEGETKSLYDLRGNYVLLDFWAGWCRPCRMENPNLVKTYNEYKSDNFTIFQVSLDRDRKTWLGAIEKDKLSQWTQVSDLQYWNSAAAQKYGVRSIPASFLLNPEGEIIAKNLRGEALGAKLKEIFGH